MVAQTRSQRGTLLPPLATPKRKPRNAATRTNGAVPAATREAPTTAPASAAPAAKKSKTTESSAAKTKTAKPPAPKKAKTVTKGKGAATKQGTANDANSRPPVPDDNAAGKALNEVTNASAETLPQPAGIKMDPAHPAEASGREESAVSENKSDAGPRTTNSHTSRAPIAQMQPTQPSAAPSTPRKTNSTTGAAAASPHSPPTPSKRPSPQAEANTTASPAKKRKSEDEQVEVNEEDQGPPSPPPPKEPIDELLVMPPSLECPPGVSPLTRMQEESRNPPRLTYRRILEERAERELASPCAAFQQNLRRLEYRTQEEGYPFDDPFVRGRGHGLEDEALFRAIAAVAEAVPGERFSVIDPVSFSLAASSNVPVPHNAVRPGREVMVPFTKDGHHSLYIFFPSEEIVSAGGISVPKFDAYHFESSARLLGQADYGTTSRNHYRDICNRLIRLKWADEDTVFGELKTWENTIAQGEEWTCGIHVILNAWAYALGLKMNEDKEQRAFKKRYPEFIDQAITLIQLALKGQLDSPTIQNFLRCYRFVYTRSLAPPNRRFRSTSLFPTERSLPEYIPKVLAAEKLKDAFGNMHGENVGVNDYLRWALVINAFVGPMDITTVSPEQFHARMEQRQGVMNSPAPSFTIPADLKAEYEKESKDGGNHQAQNAQASSSRNDLPQPVDVTLATPGETIPSIPDFEFTPSPRPARSVDQLKSGESTEAPAAEDPASDADPVDDNELDALRDEKLDAELFGERVSEGEPRAELLQDHQDADIVQQPDDLHDSEDSFLRDEAQQTAGFSPLQSVDEEGEGEEEDPRTPAPYRSDNDLTTADKNIIAESTALASASHDNYRDHDTFTSLLESLDTGSRYQQPSYVPREADHLPPTYGQSMLLPSTRPPPSFEHMSDDRGIITQTEAPPATAPASSTQNVREAASSVDLLRAPTPSVVASANDGGHTPAVSVSAVRTPGYEVEDTEPEQNHDEIDSEDEEGWWDRD